jgi:hypothetical protein
MSDARRQRLKSTIIGVLLLGLPTSCINDPYGSRDCECDLLKEWVRDLPILPGGTAIEEGITAGETEDQFELIARGPAVDIDDQYEEAIVDAFSNQGLQHEIRSDTADEWSVVFYPQSSSDGIGPDTPWRLYMTYTTGLSLNLTVNSDGASYGIADIDELWQGYDDDRQAALAIQEQRQQEAIALLELIQTAVRSLEGNG